MPPQRDRLSVEYDTTVRRVLLAAIRAHQRDPGKPRATVLFVASWPQSFRNLDGGGLTVYERAFTRSLYYQVFRVPINNGLDPQWSAKIEWGKIERRSGGRWGRSAHVRLYVYGSKAARAARKRGLWITDDGSGSWAAGTRRSLPGSRIDS